MNFKDIHFKAAAKDNLLLARKLLNDLKVPFFLSNGTLLGCMREGDLIAHDKDLDTGVFIDDINYEILPLFKSSGFGVYNIYGTPKSGYQYSFIRNGVKLDIFFYYKGIENDTMSVYTAQSEFKYVFPKLERFIDKEFLGETFKIPENWEKYLESQYGDWKTPVSEWHYAKDPKNLNEQPN